jgi:hypothetical protein
MNANPSSRWLDWQPRNVAEEELTKLTKPGDEETYLLEYARNQTDKTDKTSFGGGSVSFVSPPSGLSQKIEGGLSEDPYLLETPRTPTDKTDKTPSKDSSVSFVSALPGESPKIEEGFSREDIDAAVDLLNQTGTRIMHLESGDAIGLWSDLDSSAIRDALKAIEMDNLPVRYLDGDGIPVRYKLRQVAGDPVPDSVRREMEQSVEPWKVRNQRACTFVPWPLAEAKAPHTIDPQTGIWPISEWGTECGRGFTGNNGVNHQRQRKQARKARTRRSNKTNSTGD